MLLVCFETTIYSHPGKVDSNKNWTFVITENTFSIFNQISSLEHVIVTMSLSIEGVSYYSEYDYNDIYYYVGDLYDCLEDSHPRRGDIKIKLTSLKGQSRNYDFINAEGYDDWPFMSVHFWGENPIGNWTLKITYKSGSDYVSMSGLSMTPYGTATIPTAKVLLYNKYIILHTFSCIYWFFIDTPDATRVFL